ncbi:DNA polymerase III subunit gamma/tau [Pollutibacter soli]|uniref:DNA polymerase III subunit gamma/tau n=1 Tax=Pollutibacter soli TaxID=3034157 RepID=UPI0030132CD0
MEKFIVSARKYRPQNFSSVVGQSHITTTLKNAVRQNQLAHAFLFTGPRGVGKTTCARILAKTINCENLREDGEACDQCQSCVTFNAGTSLNIHELDAASNNSVDDIRTLTEQVRYAPQSGKYKVYIIDEVHMLSAAAFNAFLKTLEEPPPYAIFILATTEKYKILPTILSRCQIFDFRRITTEDTVEHLEEIVDKEELSAEKSALQVIAQKSEGCMRDALSILDKIVSFTGGKITYSNTLEHLNILDEEYYFRLLDMLNSQDLAGALLLFDEINRRGFDGEIVIAGFSEFLRNLMVCRDKRTLSLLEVVESFRDKYQESASKISLAWLISAVNMLNDADIGYKQAKNKKLHIELLLVRLAYLQQALTIESSGEGAVKKKRIDQFRAVSIRKLQEAPGAQTKDAAPKTNSAPPQQAGEMKARLVVETEKEVKSIQAFPKKENAPVESEAPAEKKERPTMGALQKIRAKMANKSGREDSTTPLDGENLRKAWEEYIEKLTEDKNHSTADNFKRSELVITSDSSFEIYTETNIQQKFIEQERGALINHLQQFFNNRSLNYQVIVKASEEPDTPVERPLTAREQYLKMIQAYPLIQELKERLNLDLDY